MKFLCELAYQHQPLPPCYWIHKASELESDHPTVVFEALRTMDTIANEHLGGLSDRTRDLYALSQLSPLQAGFDLILENSPFPLLKSKALTVLGKYLRFFKNKDDDPRLRENIEISGTKDKIRRLRVRGETFDIRANAAAVLRLYFDEVWINFDDGPQQDPDDDANWGPVRNRGG